MCVWSPSPLLPSTQTTHVMVLVPSSPAINMSLTGEIGYKDSMATQRRLFFDTTIHASDLVRCAATIYP